MHPVCPRPHFASDREASSQRESLSPSPIPSLSLSLNQRRQQSQAQTQLQLQKPKRVRIRWQRRYHLLAGRVRWSEQIKRDAHDIFRMCTV